MPAPITTPVTTPTVTPATAPRPFWETYTDPGQICPQQRGGTSSPDIEP